MIFALFLGCSGGEQVQFGGGSASIVLDDTAHSGAVRRWDLRGATDQQVADVTEPTMVLATGDIGGAASVLQTARPHKLFWFGQAEQGGLGTLDDAVDEPTGLACVDALNTVAFELNVDLDALDQPMMGTAFVYLRVFSGPLTAELDAEGGDPLGRAVFFSAAEHAQGDTTYGPLELSLDSPVAGSLVSSEVPWRWRDGSCGAEFRPALLVDWALDDPDE